MPGTKSPCALRRSVLPALDLREGPVPQQQRGAAMPPLTGCHCRTPLVPGMGSASCGPHLVLGLDLDPSRGPQRPVSSLGRCPRAVLSPRHRMAWTPCGVWMPSLHGGWLRGREGGGCPAAFCGGRAPVTHSGRTLGRPGPAESTVLPHLINSGRAVPAESHLMCNRFSTFSAIASHPKFCFSPCPATWRVSRSAGGRTLPVVSGSALGFQRHLCHFVTKRGSWSSLVQT